MQSLKDQRSTSTSSPSPNGHKTARATQTAAQATLNPAAGSAEALPGADRLRNAATRARIEAALAPMPGEKPAEDVIPGTHDHYSHGQYKTKRGRFRRTVMFFTLLFVRFIAWEVVIRRFTSEKFVSRGRSARWRYYARRFRALAVDMGGVMIKLGQFVSSRVDVLPPEITQELAGLQDQVPIVDFGYIKRTVQRELGPIETNFLWFNPEPIAAASFGQVHRAQLHNGDRVVVKVQRPNISDIVKTDLAALRFVARLAMRYKPIRRRANVPALLDEFSKVLYEEIDYLKEADNALRFASMFADDLGVYVPAVYLNLTTKYVMTLEDVTSLKLNDYEGMEKAGIDRAEVARRLINCYLRQIFDHQFFHADPHPGNIFIYPIPDKHLKDGDGPANSAGFIRPANGSRPFYVIFIDFGMTGKLTPQIIAGLRQTLIAVVTQDATMLVDSYANLGVLMPGADKARIEAATRAVFDKVWGLSMDDITNMPFDEVSDVAFEFSDLIMSLPFQMPQDFIYLGRTISILSGMATGLDPRFDPWREMQPFTQKLLAARADGKPANTGIVGALNGIGNGAAGLLVQTAFKSVQGFAGRVARLPGLADEVLGKAQRGELVVQVTPDPELRRQTNRIESALNQLSVGMTFATVALVSTLLYLNDERGLGTAGYVLSGVLFLMTLARGRRDEA